jgi:hypothetical protein
VCLVTLEEYLRYELEQGKIDFSMRAEVRSDGRVMVYIHPTGKDGVTTPSLHVKGNLVIEP